MTRGDLKSMLDLKSFDRFPYIVIKSFIAFLVVFEIVELYNIEKIYGRKSFESLIDEDHLQSSEISRKPSFKPKPINRSAEVEFAACLIIKDENDYLIEWIAYHYYMLNLRTIIVCDDPLSVSDPREITSRWDDLGVQTIVWNENEYIPHRMTGNTTLEYTDVGKITYLYTLRQTTCYTKCMNHLKGMNKTWTLLFDPDEFITFNEVEYDDPENVYKPKEDAGPNDTIKYEVNYYPNRKIPAARPGYYQGWKNRLKLPSLQSTPRTTVAQYIAQNINIYPFNQSCVILPRLVFGSEKENRTHILKQHLPPNFSAENFTSLVYFGHSIKNDFQPNGFGKSIIDVSKFNNIRARSPHIATNWCMGQLGAWVDQHQSLLRLNHYTRSKEAFVAKTDHRRTNQMFQSRNVNFAQSYNTQGWLEGFVEMVGPEAAHFLLHGAGRIRDYRHKDFDFMKEREQDYVIS